MIHQFRDKKQIARKRRLIKNSIFLVIFLIIAYLGFYSYSNGFLYFIGRPIWKAKNSITNKLEGVGYVVKTKASVYKENENLLKENTDLKVAMTDYQILKSENVLLKESLGRKPEGRDMVLADILTKPNYSPYDTIIIDVGDNVGAVVGDIVYSDMIIPIGEISVVYKNTSLVSLYSSPGETTEAMIDGTNTSVELTGRGGGNFEMTIPIDLPFVKGTFII